MESGIFPQPTRRRGRFKDITGQTFGRLTVVQFMGVPPEPGAKALWLCQCSCSGLIVLTTSALRTGNTRSCGCLRRDVSTARATKHGFSGVPEFQVFRSLLARCFNENNPRFHDWGGRGISVDKAWNTVDKFGAFLQEVGPRPSEQHTIERIDNNAGYVKGNMRWATMHEQSRNRRSNVWISVNGQMLCVADAAKALGLTRYHATKLAKLVKTLV